MITKFNNYIVESRKSLDELEMLTPDQLGELLHTEVENYSSDIQYIQDILDVGCPIDIRANNGMTSLHLAVIRGYMNLHKNLISMGAEPDSMPTITSTHFPSPGGVKLNPLIQTAELGQIEVVKFLISKGADINARDKYGRTAWDISPDAIKEACPELNPNA